MGWSADTSHGNESGKIRNRIAFYLQGRGLDLGSGAPAWKIAKNETLMQNCIGVDKVGDADAVCNLGNLDIFADETFDWVFSSHALEDFKNTESTLREWWKKVRVDGFFILYLPLTRNAAKEMGLENWESFYPNKGEDGANVAHQQDFDPQAIRDMMAAIGHAEIVEDEIRGGGDEYSFLLIFKKLSSYKLGHQKVVPIKQKRALVVRLGAAGDMVQATPVYRLLKEQGYHVTASCSGYGVEVVKNNPHIDEIVLQRKDQIPPTELNAFWKDVATRYDKFVNLTGSVEDNLLFPDRAMYSAMGEIRKLSPQSSDLELMESTFKKFRKLVGEKNYFDSTLEKGGFSERGLNPELYFSPEEELYVRAAREKYKDRFVVIWSLAGSSYHKWYPWFDHVVSRIVVDIPEVLFISVGDGDCVLMERTESKRYLPRSGRWGWRQTFSWLKYADLVIGPETGVLNATGAFDTPKITLLSHSTHNNLCKYWKNDYCLAPEGVFCHPCHTLHYTHIYGEPCKTCGLTHSMPEGRELTKTEKAMFGPQAFWSCPYDEMEEQGCFPICMSRGITPDRVIARIKEVHKNHWIAKREAKGLITL